MRKISFYLIKFKRDDEDNFVPLEIYPPKPFGSSEDDEFDIFDWVMDGASFIYFYEEASKGDDMNFWYQALQEIENTKGEAFYSVMKVEENYNEDVSGYGEGEYDAYPEFFRNDIDKNFLKLLM